MFLVEKEDSMLSCDTAGMQTVAAFHCKVKGTQSCGRAEHSSSGRSRRRARRSAADGSCHRGAFCC